MIIPDHFLFQVNDRLPLVLAHGRKTRTSVSQDITFAFGCSRGRPCPSTLGRALAILQVDSTEVFDSLVNALKRKAASSQELLESHVKAIIRKLMDQAPVTIDLIPSFYELVSTIEGELESDQSCKIRS